VGTATFICELQAAGRRIALVRSGQLPPWDR
jgi:hypothetical protein